LNSFPHGRLWQFVYKENVRCTRLMQRSLQVAIRQMFVLCSLKIEAIAHFIPIRWQTWSPQKILVSDWPISSNLLLWNCLAKWAELCIALLFTCQLHESLIMLYFKQFSIFQLFSWIKVKVLISFAWLELWWEAPIEGSVCIKFPQSRMKGERHRLRPLSLYFQWAKHEHLSYCNL
jgi:hypothetical protein